MKTNKQIDKELDESISNTMSNSIFVVIFNCALYFFGSISYPTSLVMDLHVFTIGLGAGAFLISLKLKILRSKKESQ